MLDEKMKGAKSAGTCSRFVDLRVHSIAISEPPPRSWYGLYAPDAPPPIRFDRKREPIPERPGAGVDFDDDPLARKRRRSTNCPSRKRDGEAEVRKQADLEKDSAEMEPPTRARRSLSFEAFILAGGVSSRMRRAKHLLDFGGVPLILQTARLVAPLVRKITVIGARQSTVPVGIGAIPDDDFGICSENRRGGPLAGIVTALSHSHSTWNLILACDMPYLNSRWLAWLFDRAAKSDAEVVIPRKASGLEPLAAVYRRDCQKAVAQSLIRRVPKVIEALKPLRLEIVNEREWREFDPDGLVLNNLNTPAEYEQAQAWFRDQGYVTLGGKLARTLQPSPETPHRQISPPTLLSLPPAECDARPPLITFCAPLAKRRNGTK